MKLKGFIELSQSEGRACNVPRIDSLGDGVDDQTMPYLTAKSFSKVPQITLAFWVIKILATTLGETGGDMMSMSFGLGYAVATFLFVPFFIISVALQIRARRFHAGLYWTVIVATTLVGTTIADFADRSLGIGYVGGSSLLFGLVLLVLAAWRLSLGSISSGNIVGPAQESFYWAAILASNTLGTALGDLTSDDSGLGYLGSAAFFCALLVVLAGLTVWTKVSRVLLFWAAFILTRPLGATLGDFMTKPVANGGLDLSRVSATAALAVCICAGVALASKAAGNHPGEAAG
jgi:uncharacterized membrane-anchored protein